MDKTTARVIGGVYLAICQGLSAEGVTLANDLLYSLADVSPQHEATVLRIIANSSVTDTDYDACEKTLPLPSGDSLQHHLISSWLMVWAEQILNPGPLSSARAVNWLALLRLARAFFSSQGNFKS